MKPIPHLTLIAAGLIALAPHLPAAVLVDYTFTSLNGNPTTTDPHATATGLTKGAGVQLTYGTPTWNAPGGGGAAAIGNSGVTTEAGAISGNDYVEFTLTAGLGYEMDLSSLTFNFARNNSSAPNQIFVRSSIDSFGSNLYTSSFPSTIPNYNSANISLSAGSFQNLTGSVTFRIYAYHGSGSTSLGSPLYLDNLTLNGITAPVVIPEPGSLALGGLGLLILAVRPRGRRRLA